MIFKKSVKQFLRTPGKLLLFLLLFAVAAFFLTAGAMLYARNRGIIAAYEKTFVTIGTVEQMPDHTKYIQSYSAELHDYLSRRMVSAYGSRISESVLDFDGANYTVSPEHRPFYGAWRPDLITFLYGLENGYYNEARTVFDFVIEFEALEDTVPDEPTLIRLTRLVGDERDAAAGLPLTDVYPDITPQEGALFRFCDHWSDDPVLLEKGKTYIAAVDRSYHELDAWTQNPYVDINWEFTPREVELTTQHRPDGTLIDDGVPTRKVQEVTEGFYETAEGRLWLAYAGALGMEWYTIPVLPTAGTELLIPFYNKVAFVTEGEDITAEEYASGAYVCLIPQHLAQRNGLSVGDTFRLPLYFADYENDPVVCFPETPYDMATLTISKTLGGVPLTAEGTPMAVFSDHEYTIKGIYDSPPVRKANMALGENTVIIPSASVRESEENNILAYGRMQATNTSFQIPNGGIEKFTEAWNRKGVEHLRITFYDRGYSQVQRGLQNMKRTSTLFLIIGGAMTLALLLFFCNLFITKNKPRTAVERMLGYTKKQCATSLLAGFLLAAVLATALGCCAGFAAEGRLSAATLNKTYFLTDFTLGQAETAQIDMDAAAIGWVCPAAAAVLLAVTYIVSQIFMHGNLKEEPLLMLGQKE